MCFRNLQILHLKETLEISVDIVVFVTMLAAQQFELSTGQKQNVDFVVRVCQQMKPLESLFDYHRDQILLRLVCAPSLGCFPEWH